MNNINMNLSGHNIEEIYNLAQSVLRQIIDNHIREKHKLIDKVIDSFKIEENKELVKLFNDCIKLKKEIKRMQELLNKKYQQFGEMNLYSPNQNVKTLKDYEKQIKDDLSRRDLDTIMSEEERNELHLIEIKKQKAYSLAQNLKLCTKDTLIDELKNIGFEVKLIENKPEKSITINDII